MGLICDMKLTDRQEKFCVKFVECGNASEAYRHAYNCEKWKLNSVNRKASELSHNVKVVARVAELKELVAEEHKITMEKIVIELEEARQIAIEDRNPASMVSATMGKAKVAGLLIDKKELSGKVEVSHEQALDALS